MTNHSSSTRRTASDHGRADDYFAIIPESILFADVSAGAIRTYAVLRTYADQNRGEAWPSRKRLAADTRCSLGSLDKYIGELVSIGAVTVTARFSDDGDRTSNLYVVHTRPRSGARGGGPKNEPPTPKTDTTGSPNFGEGVAQELIQELDPLELDPTGTNPSGTAPPPPAQLTLVNEPPQTAQTLVGEWIDYRQRITGTRPTGRVIGQLGKELRALIDEGQPYADVRAGLQLWDSKGLHPAAVASCVDEARAPRRTAREHRTEQIFSDALDRAAAGVPNPFLTDDERARAR